METTILTAEEYLKNKFKGSFLDIEYIELIVETMQDFTKIHVKEALRSASNEFERVKYDENDGDANQISTSIILNAYPDSKIL